MAEIGARSANITPAAPASAEPSTKVNTITRSMSMPIIAAASRSYEVARIALPSRVRVTSSQSSDHQHERSDDDDDPHERHSHVADVEAARRRARRPPSRTCRSSGAAAPNISCIEYARKNETPSALISGAMRGASRSGRYAKRSIATPSDRASRHRGEHHRGRAASQIGTTGSTAPPSAVQDPEADEARRP